MDNPFDIIGPVQQYRENDLRNQLLLDEQRQRVAEQKKAAVISSLLASTPVPALTKQVDNTPEIEINNLNQRGTTLLQAADQIRSLDPKLSLQFVQQGRELKQTAIQLSAQQIAEHKDVADHIVNWSSTVKDQASLDSARIMVEARHPGTWSSMKLPTVYDANSAKVFNQVALSATSMSQQLDIAQKQIDLQTRAAYNKAVLEKKQLDIIKERQDMARAASGLPKKARESTAKTLIERAADKELKITEAYTTGVAKIENEAMKLYPATLEEPGYVGKLVGRPSPAQQRADYIASKTQQLVNKRAADMAALNTWREANKLPPVRLGRGATADFGEGTKPAPVSQRAYIEGKIYTDAQGNRAKYINGQWEPL